MLGYDDAIRSTRAQSDELIHLRLRPVEPGHQANEAAAAPRDADSGRHQGLDRPLAQRDEHEIGLDRRDQTHAGIAASPRPSCDASSFAWDARRRNRLFST